MSGRLGLLRAGLMLLSLVLGAGGALLFLSSQTSALPVTFAVDDTTDAVDASPGDGLCATGAGTCTLRAAIQEANALADNVVVQLPAGTFELTIEGPGEDAAATGDLDVAKADGTLTIHGASAADTVVRWADTAVVPDRLFDIAPGAEVELVRLTLQRGAPPDGDGGAIRNAGTLALTDVVVEESSTPGNGGGIANAGALDLYTDQTGTQLVGNDAGGDGGGLYNAEGATAQVSRVTVSANSAGRDGGGVYNAGTLVVSDASLIGGAAEVLGNVAGRNGGGLAHAGGSLTVTSSTIQWNRAGTGPDGGTGGGLWADPAVRPDIRVTVLADNDAPDGGGIAAGDLVLTDVTVQRNRADVSGGGLLVAGGGEAVVIGGSVADNVATTGDGGGIENEGTLSLSRVTVERNRAPSGRGGGVSNAAGATLTADNETVFQSNQATDGGGLANAGTAALQGTRVLTNVATADGGAIWTSGPLTLRGAVVSDNSAGQRGGGVAHTGSESVELSEGTLLSGNRVELEGGGLFATGAVTLVDVQVQGNSAGQRGGGIAAHGEVEVTASLVIDNVVGLDGGGIYLADGASGVARDSAVRRNQAQTGVGGGLAVAGDATLDLSYASVTENQAGLYGGGLATLGSVAATNATVSGNVAGQRGGGVWVGPGGTVTVGFATLASNSASYGAAIYNDSGAVTVGGVLIAGSPGGGNCGGIAPVSAGGNLEDGDSCLLDGEGDLVDVDPLLQPLQSESGSVTLFHPLGAGSPALDRAPDSECPEDDQRHRPRPVGDGCDIGAYELQSVQPDPTPEPSPTPEVTPTPAVTPTVDVTPTAELGPTPTPEVTPTSSPEPSPTATVLPTVAPWSTPTPSIALPNTGLATTPPDSRRGLGLGMMVAGGFGVVVMLLTFLAPARPQRTRQ